MSDAIIVGIISAAVTLIGIIATSKSTRDKLSNEIHIKQAITDTKLQNLTDEVKRHNNFAARMPVVEEQIKGINHRLEDLERKN